MLIITIIKIIGCSVLSVLLLLLVLTLLVLFVPVRYNLLLYKADKDIKYYVKLNWFLGFIRFILDSEYKAGYRLYVLFFNVLRQKKNKTNSNKFSRRKKRRKVYRKTKYNKKKQSNNLYKKKSEIYEPLETSAVENKQTVNNKKVIDNQQNNLTKSSKVDSEPRKNNIFDLLKGIYTDREFFIEYLKRDSSKRAVEYIISLIKKLILAIKPYYGRGYVTFGFDSPDQTGLIYGLICCFIYLFPDGFSIEPDFENQMLKCDFQLKGKIQIYKLLIIIFSLYFNKQIKKIYKDLKNRINLIKK